MAVSLPAGMLNCFNVGVVLRMKVSVSGLYIHWPFHVLTHSFPKGSSNTFSISLSTSEVVSCMLFVKALIEYPSKRFSPENVPIQIKPCLSFRKHLIALLDKPPFT